MKQLRKFLDSITMYRVVLYALIFLAGSTLALSALDVLKYSSLEALSGSLIVLLTVCFFANLLLGKLYKITVNHESSLITALILFFVLALPNNSYEWVGIAYAGLVAMASKYVVTWRSSHIFNPAAFAVLLVSLVGIGNGSWWIANQALFIPMLIVGFLLLTKLRRFELFFAFFVPALLLIIINTINGSTLVDTAWNAVTLYPLLFLGAVMLTEPSTMPVTRHMRLIFGAIVGLLFASTFDFDFIASSPHLALLMGNVFAVLVTLRVSTKLKLIDKKQLTPTTYSFVFAPVRPIKRIAGQFMEFTLPDVKLDSRGNRRTFTIASAPSDKLIKIGVKFNDPSSKFKEKLITLKVGDEIIGNHIAGDFILPKNKSTPIVFVAGGIGITPFISMIGEMLEKKEKYTTDLYYFVSERSEVAYTDILKSAQKVGINVNLRVGRDSNLTDEDIKKHTKAHFYLSGPPGLVNFYKLKLKKAGVKNIHIDYFTGY